MPKPTCKLPTPYDDDPPIERCGTATKGKSKGVTFCVGDRVSRLPVKDGGKLHTFKAKGTVMGVQMGRTNNGKAEIAARVCYDNQENNDLAYAYMFSELKKL